MFLTRFACLDLKFSIFLSQYACCDFLSQYAYCVVQYMRAICILQCNMDSFLLNQKGLEAMSKLPKNFCNMHIACCNMHIAIESILPLTHVQITLIFSFRESSVLYYLLCYILSHMYFFRRISDSQFTSLIHDFEE
jgi:hypothetical protein